MLQLRMGREAFGLEIKSIIDFVMFRSVFQSCLGSFLWVLEENCPGCTTIWDIAIEIFS
jgi:hypothetical protein